MDYYSIGRSRPGRGGRWGRFIRRQHITVLIRYTSQFTWWLSNFSSFVSFFVRDYVQNPALDCYNPQVLDESDYSNQSVGKRQAAEREMRELYARGGGSRHKDSSLNAPRLIKMLTRS
jgi:hypothetical protein